VQRRLGLRLERRLERSLERRLDVVLRVACVLVRHRLDHLAIG
jgi:hypothetical protein